MAQSPAERRRAQRETAGRLRESRAGRREYEQSAAGRAAQRARERLSRERLEQERIIETNPSVDKHDLEDQFVDKMEALFGDPEIDQTAAAKFHRESVRQNAENMSREELERALRMTRDEIGLEASAAASSGRFSNLFYHPNSGRGR